MENASKALIIAGAILLAIVIISLGLIVVNNVRSTADNTNLSEQEIQSFNAKFTAYEGSSVSGSRVNTLIQQVLATNQASADAGKNHFVAIQYPGQLNGESKIIAVTYRDGKIYFGAKDSGDYAAITTEGTEDNDTDPNKGMTVDYDPTKVTRSPSFSVNTGRTYTVKITKYKNGLVKAIKVS